jgi:hypothetical protein
MRTLVKAPCHWMLVTGLLLPAAASATEPMLSYGLTHVVIGSANAAAIDGYLTFSNFRSNGVDGVSILCGEADAGLFFNPYIFGYLADGNYLRAKAYGTVNGVANRPISSMLGGQALQGLYPIEVDFSPLGASNLTFQVLSGKTLIKQATQAGGQLIVASTAYLYPRANPFWRQPDGSVGALLQFDQGVQMVFPTLFTSAYGDRVFIRADEPTNQVDFVSRVDLLGGGELNNFWLQDLRLGVFGRPHRVIGDAALNAAGGTLTVEDRSSSEPEGVVVELDSVAAFDGSFLPIELSANNAALYLSGVGSSGGSWGVSLGSMIIRNINGAIQVSAELGIAPGTVQIVAFDNGSFVGMTNVLSGDAVVDLSGSPMVIGCSLLTKTLESQPGIGIRLDRLTTFRTLQGVAFEGDELRILADDPVQFETLEALEITALHVPSMVITRETAQPFAPPRLLSFARLENTLQLWWPDPNQIFYLETSMFAFDRGYSIEERTDQAAFSNNYYSATFPFRTNLQEYFRLRQKFYPRYSY